MRLDGIHESQHEAKEKEMKSNKTAINRRPGLKQQLIALYADTD
jgi:hypothetical protein